MATATCQECGHSWTLKKPPGSYREGPRCSECGNTTDVEVENDDEADGPADGPGFDPDEAVGRKGRADELRDALEATPGVGEAGAEYAEYWFRNGVEGPEDLHDLLLEIDGVDQSVARRIVSNIYDADAEAAPPAPLAVGGSGADGDAETDDDGGNDTLDAIIKAKRAGILGDDGGGGEDVAAAVESGMKAMSEAVEKQGEQFADALETVAESGETDDEVSELRDRIDELREERRDSKIEHLEERIEEANSDEDPQALATREAAQTFREASKEAKELVESLSDEYSTAIQQGLADFEPQDALQSPRQAAQGQRGPAQAPQTATAEDYQRQYRKKVQAEADGGNGSASGSGESPDEDVEELAAETMENLGIEEGGGES